MKTVRLLFFVLLAMAPICVAQPPKQPTLPNCATLIAHSTDLITTAKASNDSDDVKRQNIHQALANLNIVAECAVNAAVTKQLEAKRTDVQAGAPANAPGTTTAVASASKPNFLGLALEDGATTQTTSGTNTTISINPWRFIESLAHDENQIIDPAAAGSALIRRFAFSLTLNSGSSSSSKQVNASSSSGTTPQTLIAQLKQVSDFTTHFDIINNRDPMSGGAARRIESDSKVPPNYFKSADQLAPFLRPDLTAEEVKLFTFSGDVKAEVQSFVKYEIGQIAQNPPMALAARTFQQAASDLIKTNNALYKGLAQSPTLSVEYSFDRQPMIQTATTSTATSTPVNPPDLHTVRLIHSWGYYTANASASFFGSEAASMPDVWRDLQLGVKVDIPFSGLANVVDKGTFTLSGLFVNLHQKPLGVDLTINGVTVNQPGRIGLFQAKYTVPLGNSTGVQVPISVTYSNRTDLIKESKVQGNVGITFDWSKLVAAKRASGTP